jgi:hypothetical protein
MKKIFILLFMLLPLLLFAQQTNYTFGQKTSGVAWNETGKTYTSGVTDVVQIVLDFEDYYPWSTADQYGVFFYTIDANSATDSSNYSISFFNGAFIYDDGSSDRITTSKVEFSSDSTLLQASSSQANDITWTALEVTVSGQILPPEFGLIEIEWETGTDDSLAVQWYFAYPAVYQSEQEKRSTKSGAKPRKSGDTLE